MLSTFSRLVPSKVYEAWIFLIRFMTDENLAVRGTWNGSEVLLESAKQI